MATYQEIYNLRQDTELHARVVAALADVAGGILQEAVGTAHYEARRIWAMSVLENPEPHANRMFWAILGNHDVQNQGNALPDANLRWVVNYYVNLFAVGQL